MKKLCLILIIFMFLSLISLLGVYYKSFAVFSCFGPPEIISNTSEYTKILKGWEKSDLANHFPSKIPESATKICMSFFPGYLQGGAHFHLHTTLPSEEVATYDKRYARQAIYCIQKGDIIDHIKEPNVVNTTLDYLRPLAIKDIPDTFITYVLQANPAGSAGHKWNHGSNAGLSISRQTNEVIFYCESW